MKNAEIGGSPETICIRALSHARSLSQIKTNLFVLSGTMSLVTHFVLWPIPCGKKFLELDRGYSI